MNEIQGPTPTGTARLYRSLAEALRAHRIPVENHEFIDDVTTAVGISGYIDRGRYIEAIRATAGPALHIGRTYINGFEEGEDLLIRDLRVVLQPSEGREPYFYATHPSERPGAVKSTRTRAAGARSTTPREPATTRTPKPVERDYGACEVCFMVKNASGKCNCD